MSETDIDEEQIPFESLLRLNEMLSRIVDAREGYRQASAHAQGDARLQRLFASRMEQRDRFASEIQKAVAACGRELNEEMSLEATWKAGVRSLKELFSSHPPAEVLDECLATEQRAVDEYDLLVEMPSIPREMRALLKNQRGEIVAEMAELDLARKDLG